MDNIDLLKTKYAILQELSNVIAVTDNITTITNLLLDLAINYAHAEKGSLMLLTERNELVIFAAKGIEPRFFSSYKTRVGEGIAGEVASTRTPVLVEDIEIDKGFKNLHRERYKTRSFISCPIISKSKLLGILNINDKKDGSPFNMDELELVITLANHAAIALENTFLLTQLKSNTAELEEINRKLEESDILKTEFLTRISHELRTPLNSIKGAIYILEQAEAVAEDEQREFQGIISTEVNNLIYIVENLLSFLRLEDESRVINKSVLNIRAIFNELQDSKKLKTILARKGIHMTLESADDLNEIIGDKIKVVQLFTNMLDGLTYYLERGDTIHINAASNGYVTINITLSRALPDIIMPIIHDSHYFFQIEHPEHHLKIYLAKNIATSHRWKLLAQNTENMCHLTLLIPTSAKDATAILVDRSMDSFIAFIAEVLDLDICSIMLTDELTSELTVKSAIGLDDDIVKSTRIKFGDKIAGWVALEGKPLFIDNIESDPRFAKKSISQYSTKSLMSLPLKIGDRVIGVLNLNNKKTSETFTTGDYSVATIMSEKISHFIEILYSDNGREEKLRQFMTSMDDLFASGTVPRAKLNLLPELIDMLLKKSNPLAKSIF